MYVQVGWSRSASLSKRSEGSEGAAMDIWRRGNSQDKDPGMGGKYGVHKPGGCGCHRWRKGFGKGSFDHVEPGDLGRKAIPPAIWDGALPEDSKQRSDGIQTAWAAGSIEQR